MYSEEDMRISARCREEDARVLNRVRQEDARWSMRIQAEEMLQDIRRSANNSSTYSADKFSFSIPKNYTLTDFLIFIASSIAIAEFFYWFIFLS